MADKGTNKYERPKKIRVVKVKHPKGFGTEKSPKMRKVWYEARCNGKVSKGSKEMMEHIVKNCTKEAQQDGA